MTHELSTLSINISWHMISTLTTSHNILMSATIGFKHAYLREPVFWCIAGQASVAQPALSWPILWESLGWLFSKPTLMLKQEDPKLNPMMVSRVYSSNTKLCLLCLQTLWGLIPTCIQWKHYNHQEQIIRHWKKVVWDLQVRSVNQ